MFDDKEPDPACAVCARRLLPGERPIEFVTREGEVVEVCELCKPRAEAAGWLRPEEADAGGGAGGRDRRRGRGAGMFSGFLARGRQAAGERREAAAGSEDGAGRRRTERHREPDPDPAPAPELPPVGGPDGGTTVAEALYAFNHSDHRRTVAGLTRTLGSPRATALAATGNGEGEVVRLTIAWEITWYQWEVAAGERGHEVRETGKGDTIGQLDAADRAWNLMVAADGTLQEKTAATAPAEEA